MAAREPESPVLETPKWLEALENKRKRPHRLAHEVGAGAPCLICKHGCAGLNLHFWRKICVECKCRKEDHDIQEEDDYSQFEILFGAKKVKRTTLKFNAQNNVFDWIPPDIPKELALDYLNAIPKSKVPISNTDGAKYRKQQLEKQLPLHDIDPSACHDLTKEEIQALEKYLENLKDNVVGQGKISKFMTPAKYNEQFVKNVVQGKQKISSEDQENIPQYASPYKTFQKQPVGAKYIKTQPTSQKLQSEAINTCSYPVQGQIHSSTIDKQSGISTPVKGEAGVGFTMGISKSGNVARVPMFGQSLTGDPDQITDKGEDGYLVKNKVPAFYQTEYQRNEENADFASKLALSGPKPYTGVPQNPTLNQINDFEFPEQIHLKTPGYFATRSESGLPVQEKQGQRFENDQRNNQVGQTAYSNEYDTNLNEMIGALPTNESLQYSYQPTNILNSGKAPALNAFKSADLKAQKNILNLSSKVPLDQVPYNASYVSDDPSYLIDRLNVTPENVPFAPVQECHVIVPKPKSVPENSDKLETIAARPETNREKQVESIPQPPQICVQCCQVLNEGDVVVTTERGSKRSLWHARCFVCETCKELLVDLMYFYHKDKVYCGRHYAEMMDIPRCFACDELIFVNEYTLAENEKFHFRHFCCFHCDQPLGGKSYIPKDGQPVCLDCYQLKYGKCCHTCKLQIMAEDQRVSWNDLHFHVSPKCFKCTHCSKCLLGGRFVVQNGNIFCNGECFRGYSK